MSAAVAVETGSGVLTIRFDRPEKKNALTLSMYTAAADALEGADAREDVRVVLLTGTEDCFTAGHDLRDFLDNPPGPESGPAFRFLEALVRLRCPLVAAVNGVAIGIGTTMLLHCDLVYAGESATLRLPFIDLGLVPEGGSSWLLPRLVGHHHAAELLMLGEPFDAATAARHGIVNRVYPDAEVQARAREWAEKLAAKPPEALRLTKELLRRGDEHRVREAMSAESERFARRLESSEVREAMRAFLGGRRPRYSRVD